MGTVSKEIADDIVAGKYPEDEAVKIVKYNNAFDGKDAYGVVFKGEPFNKYEDSAFVLNPSTYWTK